jgi:hypothetical protein
MLSRNVLKLVSRFLSSLYCFMYLYSGAFHRLRDPNPLFSDYEILMGFAPHTQFQGPVIEIED